MFYNRRPERLSVFRWPKRRSEVIFFVHETVSGKKILCPKGRGK